MGRRLQQKIFEIEFWSRGGAVFRVFSCKILAQTASNELIGSKWSFWAVRDLIKIWGLAKSSKKVIGPQTWSFDPKNTIFFENFETIFSIFSKTQVTVQNSYLKSFGIIYWWPFETIWGQKMKKVEKIVIFKNNFWPLGGVKSKFWWFRVLIWVELVGSRTWDHEVFEISECLFEKFHH